MFLVKLIKPVNKEEQRDALISGNLQLYEAYFIQYAILFFNCETQYMRLINLKLYQIIEKFWQENLLNTLIQNTEKNL